MDKFITCLTIFCIGNYFVSATPHMINLRREPNSPKSNVQVHYNLAKSQLGSSYLNEVSYTDFDLSGRPRTCNDCVCGISRTSRIVNGNITDFFEFPWVVSIHIEGKYQCGGSLITRRHVLTVSHCFISDDPQEYLIILADNNLPNSKEYLIKRRVASIKMHESYDFNSGNKNNDIGIIELAEPVSLDGIIQTACLPENKPIDYSGAVAVAVGRGHTGEDEPVSDELRKVYVHVLAEEECKQAGYMKGKVTDNMFCAGYLDGQYDTCNGDSGGPLHVKGSHGFLEIIGLISFGRGCARPGFPGVYTRVTKYMDWIANQLNQDDSCVCQTPGL